MSDFTMTIKMPDMSGVLNSGFFSKFNEYLAVHKEETESKIKKILQNYARDGHRELGGRHYSNQTYRLRSSTRATGDFGKDFEREIKLSVDLTQAPYGVFVIRGNGRGWEGDPFIDEAAQVKQPEITKIIVDYVNEAITKFNQ